MNAEMHSGVTNTRLREVCLANEKLRGERKSQTQCTISHKVMHKKPSCVNVKVAHCYNN
jgi:hypothetical protein